MKLMFLMPKLVIYCWCQYFCKSRIISCQCL